MNVFEVYETTQIFEKSRNEFIKMQEEEKKFADFEV
jgi:hypothetical protein